MVRIKFCWVSTGLKDPGAPLILWAGRCEGGKFKVKLIHVMRGKEDRSPEVQRLYVPAKYTQFTRKEVAAELLSARQKLVGLGFKAAQVSTERVGGASSRAGTIAAEARQNGYGTIVMGRRGHSRVRDFFIGRVTNKVIHMARDRTLWIVR